MGNCECWRYLIWFFCSHQVLLKGRAWGASFEPSVVQSLFKYICITCILQRTCVDISNNLYALIFWKYKYNSHLTLTLVLNLSECLSHSAGDWFMFIFHWSLHHTLIVFPAFVCSSYWFIHLQIVAIAARSLESAQQFAQKFSIGKAYGSYKELAEDPAVGKVSNSSGQLLLCLAATLIHLTPQRWLMLDASTLSI